MENTMKICSICGCGYTGWGNNAWPVNDGRCCNQCNSEYVIPARLNRMYGNKENSEEKEED